MVLTERQLMKALAEGRDPLQQDPVKEDTNTKEAPKRGRRATAAPSGEIANAGNHADNIKGVEEDATTKKPHRGRKPVAKSKATSRKSNKHAAAAEDGSGMEEEHQELTGGDDGDNDEEYEENPTSLKRKGRPGKSTSSLSSKGNGKERKGAISDEPKKKPRAS